MYKFIKHLTVIGFLLFSSLCFAADNQASDNKWHGWVEFGGYIATDEASRGETAAFIPLMQDGKSIFFTEMRGKLFEQEELEGNLAFGFRHMYDAGWNVGAWTGYDYRLSDHEHHFHQVSGGLEALSDNYDLRINGYLPINREETISTAPGTPASTVISGGGLFIQRTPGTSVKEYALYGLDGEMGAKLFETNDSIFRLYAGGFWFDHEDTPSVYGPRGRFEWSFNDLELPLPGARLALEGEIQYDKIRHTKAEIGAKLRIPFGASDANTQRPNHAQSRRMTAAIERDTDIVSFSTNELGLEPARNSSATNENLEPAIDALSGVQIDHIEYINSTDDFAKLQDPQKGNTLFIVNITDNRAAPPSPINVSNDRVVLGGGTTLQVKSATSDTTQVFDPGIPVSAEMDMPTFILKGSNVHISGLNVRTNFEISDDMNGIFFTKNKIDSFNNSAPAIDVGENVKIIISDSEFDASFASFIAATKPGYDIEVDNSLFQWSEGAAILLRDVGTVKASQNRLEGHMAGLFIFDGRKNTGASTIRDGSTNNVNNSHVLATWEPDLHRTPCSVYKNGSFTGRFEINGTTHSDTTQCLSFD